MTQAAKAQEPSMEEILASIRRIIADDDANKPAKAPEAATLAKPTVAAPGRPAPLATPQASAKPAAAAPSDANSQEKIDAMLADLDAPPKATARAVTAQPSAPVADVLDLTEAMAAPVPSAPSAPTRSFRTIDATSDVVLSNKPEPPPERALISNETIAAVDSAFNTLAHTVIGQNARTLEDLVREMLRPMLKSWLDDNLPSMVERIVRAEIERVSRGRP
jgi:cell pole-organizing protein PopZ